MRRCLQLLYFNNGKNGLALPYIMYVTATLWQARWTNVHVSFTNLEACFLSCNH